jgi:hypothetical protein
MRLQEGAQGLYSGPKWRRAGLLITAPPDYLCPPAALRER